MKIELNERELEQIEMGLFGRYAKYYKKSNKVKNKNEQILWYDVAEEYYKLFKRISQIKKDVKQ
jgi:hypothetical protein